MKSDRQKLILKIVSEESIDTQEHLQKALRKHGLKVTQATVSRDIKELSLLKTVSEKGGYKYSVPKLRKEPQKNDVLYAIISDAVNFVDYAMNTVVVKCSTGMAQAVCAKLDSLELENVVGTLAGDDTIFILMRTEADAERLVRELKSIIPQ